jgi:hypothetical protein
LTGKYVRKHNESAGQGGVALGSKREVVESEALLITIFCRLASADDSPGDMSRLYEVVVAVLAQAKSALKRTKQAVRQIGLELWSMRKP